MMRIVMRAAIAAATLALAPGASAHVTLETPTAPVGASYKAVLRVGHGCAGAATHTVRVRIPEGFHSVKPMPKPGWTLDVVTGPYAQPYEEHGVVVSEGVTEIIWSGGELPDAFYDEFVFRGTFAASLEAGSFYFPTVQQCAGGEEAWLDVSGAADAGMPAPRLELTPASGGHAH